MCTKRRWFWLMVWLVLVPAAMLLFVDRVMAESATANRPDCQDVVTAIVNTTVRRMGGVVTECFETLSPVGSLDLDVTVTDAAAFDARIDFHGAACEGAAAVGSWRVVDALASSLTVEVGEAGRLVYCVTSPTLLPEYKLRVAHGAPLPQKGGDPTEQEIDPDPLRFSLCDAGEVDDHGDTLGCATRVDLGGWAAGRLANDWGDDDDFFVFFVDDGQRPTVEILLSAKGQRLAVELYDHLGFRLAGGVDHERWVKTLVGPAWYAVRVHGGPDRAQGPYRLMFRVLRWR